MNDGWVVGFPIQLGFRLGVLTLVASGINLKRIIPRRNIMNVKTKKLIGLALTTLLTASLATPSLAHADRGHHGHSHHKHKRHKHKHHHHHHHDHDHHRHSNGHMHIYSQPPVYYQQHYPQSQYNYNYNYYPPAPVYVVPPRMNMGISAGNVDFMLRF
ncbi:hypothetical protein Neut_1364 [Nitrosomonas eutropha C91]|uniref:Transmembrane protein n=2 Tax=Nitrosomonas eutropha TaxID=916 RepID=Q0AGC0_NITEC|nr:hypothetical protein Neut_1364 [Nitrosomonas eutropha C91]